jgi:hypothetical protein
MIMRSKDAPGISAYKSARRNATNGTDLAIPSRVKASTSDPLVAVIVICATARLPRVMRSVDADGQGAAVLRTISVASLSKKRHYSGKSDFLIQGFYQRPISVVFALQRFARNRSGR